MIFFANDYAGGAHPDVLRAVVESNEELLAGYGEDPYCERAKEKIRKCCQAPQADIFFIPGGTQANMVVLKSLLGACEGVLAADSGHISIHEAGTIEAGGHKVITLPHREGKLSAAAVREFVDGFYEDRNHMQMVYPAAVYLSYPTEYGTVYSKKELYEIADVCREKGLLLYLDGARLGYGLAIPDTDVTLADIAKVCDAFYIGGTKVGALCGEAIVFPNGNAPRCFTTFVRQQGGLLAKGRLLGVQFDALFTADTYTKICKPAIHCADALREVFRRKGYPFYVDSPSNQIFVIMEDEKFRHLQEYVVCRFWKKVDAAHTVVRFVTSWATTIEDVRQLELVLENS
jgi:threonine aldolase